MNLQAGSYLKLLRDPTLDLLEVVNEEAPPMVRKVQSKTKYAGVVLKQHPNDDPQYVERRVYTFPYYDHVGEICYENTHGLRFANCEQVQTTFVCEPFWRNDQVMVVQAHNGSDLPNRWSTHYVSEDQSDLGPGVDFAPNFGLVCWDSGVTNELWPGYPGTAHHLPIEEDDLDIDAELVRAYDTIRPAITSDMSLLVTIAELKDVKSLFAEPLSFADKVVRLVGRKRAKGMTLRTLLTDPDLIPFIAKSLAKGKLYNEFGLKQTERDVCALYSTFLSLDRIVREILAATGTNTRHYSLPVFTRDTDVFEHRFQDYNWILSRLWRTVFSCKFVCTIKYTSELTDAFGQPISPNDPELVRLGAALDTLGVNMNPAILWDLVPFSFVVDYFCGIGDWLERFKRTNLNLSFSVVDSCYSVKREWITEGTTHRWNSVWNGEELYPDHPLAARERYIGGCKFSLHTKTYSRKRFVPSLRMRYGIDEPDWRLPNIGQLKIMASMLTQNIPFGKR